MDKSNVFINGVRIWGEGITPGEKEEIETEHIDYADNTYAPVTAKMYNSNRDARCK